MGMMCLWAFVWAMQRVSAVVWIQFERNTLDPGGCVLNVECTCHLITLSLIEKLMAEL